MDAAEADADVKLYKASGELLLELKAKVPRLVQHSQHPNKFRKWVINSKIYEVVTLLDSFQEWPQLLDPHLTGLVQILVDGYLWYCVHHPREYLRKCTISSQLSPLSQAVALVLYSLCKVRGRKVIVRLLNNEPKYVEPLLSCFQLWTAAAGPVSRMGAPTFTWEERYIHMLWLSHLMLAPFELSTISGLPFDASGQGLRSMLDPATPDIAYSLTLVGLDHLFESSKARETATILLVRLSLRSDMLQLGMSNRLVEWTMDQLRTPLKLSSQSPGYRFIGLLDLLFGIVNSASDSEAMSFVVDVFRLAHSIVTSQEAHDIAIRDSAPARKLLVKIIRSTVIHAMTADATHSFNSTDLDVNTMLEDSIQVLLDLLADKDTPVRQAASKALSLICLKLDAEMASEVVEATIDSLNENLFLEDVKTGSLLAITDMPQSEAAKYKKNLNAVDPLKWHGCMLTLGHLLFRRSLPATQLQSVIEALIMGLNFEQRSNVGTSIGVGVRDAACFGIWSLARKYSTSDLNQTPVSATLLPLPASFSRTGQVSTLQLIAMHLTMSACMDPSGNLRRGASAALQELIGRHPDAIKEGIPVVQTVDYHAVARRSRAVTGVAVATSDLSGYYHGSLLYALLGWRGARSTDADSRRLAADAAGLLISMATTEDALAFSYELVSQILQLKASNSGTNAAARHGLLCMLAAIVKVFFQEKDVATATELFEALQPAIQDIAAVVGMIDGRTTVDLENVLESASKLALECATAMSKSMKHGIYSRLLVDVDSWVSIVLSVLDRCTVATDKAFVTDVAAHANVAVLKILGEDAQRTIVSSLLDEKQQNKGDFTCRGRITTLGEVSGPFQSTLGLQELHHQIIVYLNSIITSPHTIETKVIAMQGIATVISTNAYPQMKLEDQDMLMAAVQCGLTDYTVDQRGDIGSLLRLESIAVVTQFNSVDIDAQWKQQMLTHIVRLAAEKLVKVRFQAWLCLRECLGKESKLRLSFNHQADVSSFEYFRNLLMLLQQPQCRDSLLVGLTSCIASGTEEVARVSSQALIAYIQGLNEELQQATTDSIVQCIVDHAANSQSLDDREIIPAIDFVSFFIEHVVAFNSSTADSTGFDVVWTTFQELYMSATTLLRTEAMIRLYSAFTLMPVYRSRAFDKLTRLLLHRWPKVRGAAADAIVLRTPTQLMTTCDWNAPAANNKSIVVKIRKELNVAGLAAATKA